jgi:hypothetical protein
MQFAGDSSIWKIIWIEDNRLLVAGDVQGRLHWLEWVEMDQP